MSTEQLTTVARPYVAAVFAEAAANNTLAEWRDMLDAASLLTQNISVQKLLAQPGIGVEKLVEFYHDLLAELLTPEQVNFIRLLATNKRLLALPKIAELYGLRHDEFNKTLTVHVQSAIALSDHWRKRLTDKLSLKLQRKIVLDCVVDETILAGVIVTAGDYVMDGSVRGKLARLGESVSGIF